MVPNDNDDFNAQWPTKPDLWDKLKPLASQMRCAPTPAENHLWQYIRREALGAKFRRQQVFHRFIVDFYSREARLIIEVDGTIHEYTREEDAIRQEYLENLGLRVLRFTNGEVLQHTQAVLERIGEVLIEQRGLHTSQPPHSQSFSENNP
ncbi:MAG: endonuclease domain-containing protein [Chloroflexota bacterium]